MKKLSFFPLLVLVLSTMFLFSQCKGTQGEDEPDPDTEPTCIALEDLTPVVEVASFDTTFAKENEYMSCTVNWKEPFSDEAALVKISVAEQLDMLAKAKKGNGGKDVDLYVSAVQIWPAATALYAAIAYKGNQNDFTEITKGEDVERTVVGNTWTRLVLDFSCPCKITGKEDIFVGAFASNAAAGTYPFTILSKNPTKFPGLTAKYPSYGVCPSVERYLQELNDPNEAERWGWVSDANWAIKLVISKEIVY